MPSKEVAKSNDNVSDSTSSVLKKTLQSVAEGITGIASSDRQTIALSVGHILQRIRGGEFLSQIQKEWQEMRERGKIGEDYIQSIQHKECLQELLDYLDDKSPDNLRFEALKQIFLKAATEDLTDRDSILPQQYMRIIRSLTAGEAILLVAAMEFTDTVNSAKEWCREVAGRSPLQFAELVEFHEKGLMEKQLLTPRAYADGSGVIKGQHGRLTSLGYSLCTFIKSEG